MGYLLRRDARLSPTCLRPVLRHRHSVQVVPITGLLQHWVVFTHSNKIGATTIKSLLQSTGSKPGFLGRCYFRTHNRRIIYYWVHSNYTHCRKTESNHSPKSWYFRHSSEQYWRLIQHVIYWSNRRRLLCHRNLPEPGTLPASIRSTSRRQLRCPHYTSRRRHYGIALQCRCATGWN
jgi:hypothetical protein